MRLFSTTTTAISLRKSPILSQSPRRSVYALSQVFFTPTTRFGGILSFSDRPTTEMAHLFPGCDYKHWLIVMDHKPGGEGATKQQMIDCYVQTLAKVLGSEEEAKKKIYSVSCERYFGFGCEIDEETSNKFEGMNGVLFVLPDSYVDPENKDYGGKYPSSNGSGSSPAGCLPSRLSLPPPSSNCSKKKKPPSSSYISR